MNKSEKKMSKVKTSCSPKSDLFMFGAQRHEIH